MFAFKALTLDRDNAAKEKNPVKLQSEKAACGFVKPFRINR